MTAGGLYGVTWTKVVFELLAYGCLGLCVWHAWGLGALRRARLLELAMGVAYGVTLEALTIAQFHAYRYGHFLVMLRDVPLCIGVDWGVILYSAMSFADGARLPRWAAPALVGLLGLTIDFSMDAVAIRQDMWHWNVIGLMDQWYGVPWGNFFAWYIVLCSASAPFWLARPLTWRPDWRGPLALVGAYAGSLAILAGLDELVYRYDLTPGSHPLLPAALVAGLGLVVTLAGLVAREIPAAGGQGARRGMRDRAWLARRWPLEEPLEPRGLALAAIPLYFHLLFTTALLVSGIGAELPPLLAVSLAMLAMSLALHGWQAWRTLGRRAAAPQVTAA